MVERYQKCNKRLSPLLYFTEYTKNMKKMFKWLDGAVTGMWQASALLAALLFLLQTAPS
jgi:hypothetical protein